MQPIGRIIFSGDDEMLHFRWNTLHVSSLSTHSVKTNASDEPDLPREQLGHRKTASQGYQKIDPPRSASDV
jgi:hypothetical protein